MAEETANAPAKTTRKRTTANSTSAAGANGADSKSSKGVVAKAKETTSKLATEAKNAARNAANEGKDKASEALTSVSKAVEGAASLVEEKVGPAYGNYARKAADQVSGFAQNLQSKDIDDLIEDTRTFIRKQPIVAIGAAAAIGFVLTRLIKIGANGLTTTALPDPMSGGADEVVDDASVSRPTVGALFARLTDEGRDLFHAEFALYRAEAGRRALSAGWAAGLLLGAVVLASGALIALLVGLILLFAPMIGTGWAVAAVTLGALALGGVLAWLGIRQIDTMLDPEGKR